MAEKEKQKPVGRVIFWEAAAAYGLFRLLQNAPAQDPVSLPFTYNAVFFLAAYPFFAFWKFAGVPGLVKFILFPVGILLRIGLLVSAYVWVGYFFWSFGRLDLLAVWAHRAVIPAILFLFLYIAWLAPLWGTRRPDMGFGDLARLTLFTLAAGLVGALMGRGLQVSLPADWNETSRLWILLNCTLAASLVGAWVGGVGSKKKGD